MGMRYRSRTEIITQILEIVNDGGSSSSRFGDGGVSKTKIMYKAFLSYNQLKEYLAVLTKSDLLSYDGQTRMSKTTEKGLGFLKAYAQINQLMKEQEI
ncbi:MAG TPA: winged helix-turn-helix domain-containing protein [Nitrososphaera sp.]|nr:winged helix-turn-helix domain-containing protein [Nitrososphaera sp.]